MREFHPEDILGFGVFGYDEYRSAKVSYHVNPKEGTDIPGQFSDSMGQNKFF